MALIRTPHTGEMYTSGAPHFVYTYRVGRYSEKKKITYYVQWCNGESPILSYFRTTVEVFFQGLGRYDRRLDVPKGL